MVPRRKGFNQNSHKARDSNLSKKIDQKLTHVADMMAYAVGEKHVKTQATLFEKRLFFREFHFLTYLDLKYHFENRLMAISYNLELSSEIKTKEKNIGAYIFEVTTKGRLNIKEATWVCISHDGDLEAREKLLAGLNNKLIQSRILALDLQKIRVIHEADSDVWHIRCESMIGSSTWVLIPPVVNLIKPKAEECIQFIEFFELVSDALTNGIS